jgi:hypothetical protein
MKYGYAKNYTAQKMMNNSKEARARIRPGVKKDMFIAASIFRVKQLYDFIREFDYAINEFRHII